MPEVTINGPEGRIEGRYLHAKTPNAPIALFLHPHPLHGGTMNNKVVYSLYHAFSERGFSCLRFNFRGVGAGLVADQKPGRATMLDRRIFLRRLDRHAASHAAAGNSRLHFHRAAGKHV